MGGLALTSLRLSHFRSHKLAQIVSDGRPVAIHGPNGAGKTNLIEAVSLLSPGRGLRGASAQDMARQPEALGWKISAAVQVQGRAFEIDLNSEAGAPRQTRIDGKSRPQTELAALVRVLWLVPAMDRLWIEGADGRRRFLDRATLSFHPGHAAASLRYDKAMRERNRLLKDQVREPAWYAALESELARSGAVINTNRLSTVARLMAAQSGAATAFPTATLALTQSDDGLPEREDELQTALADNRSRDMAAGRTLIGPHRSDLSAIYTAKDVPARACSTGEQKALLVSLILANARALAADIGAPPLLLLDEVAAHLDADRRAALYDEICALGAQAWMTGTGPELFAELGERAQVLEVTEQGGVSDVAPG